MDLKIIITSSPEDQERIEDWQEDLRQELEKEFEFESNKEDRINQELENQSYYEDQVNMINDLLCSSQLDLDNLDIVFEY